MWPYEPKISCRCASVTFLVNFSTTIFELCGRLVGRPWLEERLLLLLKLRSLYDLLPSRLGLLLLLRLPPLPYPFRGSRTSGDRDAEYDLCLTEGDLDLVFDLGLGERDASCAGEEAGRAEVGVCDRLGDLPRDLDGEGDIMIRFEER